MMHQSKQITAHKTSRITSKWAQIKSDLQKLQQTLRSQISLSEAGNHKNILPTLKQCWHFIRFPFPFHIFFAFLLTT